MGEVTSAGECMFAVPTNLKVLVCSVAGEVTINTVGVCTVESLDTITLVNRTVVRGEDAEDVVPPDVAHIAGEESRLVSGTVTLAGKDLSLTCVNRMDEDDNNLK